MTEWWFKVTVGAFISLGALVALQLGYHAFFSVLPSCFYGEPLEIID